MGKKIITFDLPSWLVVFLRFLKRILITLTISGAVGMVADSTYQFKPWAMLLFLCLREGIAEIMTIYIKQEISDDENN